MSIASVLESLRKEYRPTLQEEATRLRTAIAAEDWPAARRIAHRIAGTGGSYGYKEAGLAARAIEDAIGEDPGVSPIDHHAIPALLATLEGSI